MWKENENGISFLTTNSINTQSLIVSWILTIDSRKFSNILDEYLSKVIFVKQNLRKKTTFIEWVLYYRYMLTHLNCKTILSKKILPFLVLEMKNHKAYVIKDGNLDTSDSKVYVLIYSLYSFMIPKIKNISEFSHNESIIRNNRLYSRIQ